MAENDDELHADAPLVFLDDPSRMGSSRRGELGHVHRGGLHRGYLELQSGLGKSGGRRHERGGNDCKRRFRRHFRFYLAAAMASSQIRFLQPAEARTVTTLQ